MTFVTFLWRQSCQTQLSLDGISSASHCRTVSIQRPHLPKIAVFLSPSPCVSVIYALIDINACMMHSCSYCHKQKVNHACVEGLLFQEGKDDNCPFVYSQGLPSSSIWFTCKTMTKVPLERKCKEAKVLSMLFTFLQGAKKKAQVFALGFYRSWEGTSTLNR